MAISIDWSTKIIFIPQSYLTNLGGGIYELDIDQFRKDLKDIEDDEEGMNFLHTHNHNTQITISGITLARVIEIVNGYTVTFEDNQYAVELSGANSNIADITNVNQVSVRPKNSAGLIAVGGGGSANDVWNEILPPHVTPDSAGKILIELRDMIKLLKNITLSK